MDIETLLAKHEIMELRLGYSAHLDARNYDLFMDLFTDDAVCEFGPEFGGNWVGRAEIRARYEDVMVSAGAAFEAIHVVTNPWITLDGPDTAHGRWYLLDCLTRQITQDGLRTRGGHDNPLLYLGIYEDDYRRDAGKWRISRTRLHFLWPDRAFNALAHSSGG